MIEWTEEKLIEEGYKLRNARIANVDLSTEDFCCLNMPMTLDGDGWGVVYGGYTLGRGGTAYNFKHIEGYKSGLSAIMSIMYVVGVDSFNDLKGKYVRVATKDWGDTVKIIGHITKDQWFDYGSFFKKENEEE